MFVRPNAVHSQVAYVTTDLDRAIAVFRDEFDVPGFFCFGNDAPGLEQSDDARLRIALARVGDVEIEVIEPIGDTAPLFSAILPGDAFAIRFHHVAYRILGSLADYDAHIASIDQARHPIVWHGRIGDMLRYAYTDERATLGHFVEHVWLDEAHYAGMAERVPSYPSRAS